MLYQYLLLISITYYQYRYGLLTLIVFKGSKIHFDITVPITLSERSQDILEKEKQIKNKSTRKWNNKITYCRHSQMYDVQMFT